MLMASMAGSENPSYSDGTTATAASAYRFTISASLRSDTNRTASLRPIRSGSSPRVGLSARGRPMIVSSALRPPARSSGQRLQQVGHPLHRHVRRGGRDQAVRRPGRSTSGIGRNTSGSTPTGTTVIRSGGTRWSRLTSVFEDPDTVSTSGRRLATRVCILVKEYQRFFPKRSWRVLAWAISRRRSTVIGWWMVAMSGRPARRTPHIP